MKKELLEKLKPIIEQRISPLDLELYDLKFIQAGSYSILRVFIENSGGITVEHCAQASEAISLLLDEGEYYDGNYTLEVSSPGIDRPLTTLKDFSRVIGKNIQIRYEDEKDKVKTIVGTLTAITDETVSVDSGKIKHSVPFKKVLSGKIELKF